MLQVCVAELSAGLLVALRRRQLPCTQSAGVHSGNADDNFMPCILIAASLPGHELLICITSVTSLHCYVQCKYQLLSILLLGFRSVCTAE